MKCFSCQQEIENGNKPCPHCGYQFTMEWDMLCPNAEDGICLLNEMPCAYGYDWQKCQIKSKAENESGF